jgi:hypothetical protein
MTKPRSQREEVREEVRRMPPRIEDYALLGRTQTTVLVSGDSSIHWLSLARCDSAVSFAALLACDENGRWRVAPYGHVRATRRRYRGDTLVLETDFDTAAGSIRLVDFMPPRGEAPDVVRLIEGIRGCVRVQMHLRVRFDTGRVRPWLCAPVETCDAGSAVRADFFVSAGELVPLVLTWHPSDEVAPAPIDPFRALADTESYWTERVCSNSDSGGIARGGRQVAR